MTATTITVGGEQPYPVVVGVGVLSELPRLVPGTAQQVVLIYAEGLGEVARPACGALTSAGFTVHAEPIPDGEQAKTAQVAANLWSKLAECETFEERVLAAEHYLMPFASRARGRTLITKTAHHMLDRKGAVRIDEIANQARLSVRQYERRFLEEIGLTPKTFARTTRFQQALDAKRFFPGRTWLSVAHEFGYFDQMHMVRDFQRLCGMAPSDVLDLSGDIQPWSLPAHKTLELR